MSTARPYEDLLAAAGFTQISRTDCTAEFAATAQAWLSEWDASFAALAAMYGEQTVAERRANAAPSSAPSATACWPAPCSPPPGPDAGAGPGPPDPSGARLCGAGRLTRSFAVTAGDAARAGR